MSGRDQIEKLWISILGLGGRRLTGLGIVGAVVLLTITFGAYYVSQPEREVLYTGLERGDVSQIGAVLRDAGISFDASADGTSVLVGYADTARARMLLAEKGLPQSAHSGYELFNDLGSFGLTSFMQDVTRVRALEGELARTIQTMDGIKAARVHLVMPERASFRRDQQQASASVVIRTQMPDDTEAAQAIRYLVAAAIPAMEIDDVTVLNTEGAVLASGDDPSTAGTGRMAELQHRINRDVEEKIRRTLTPYLGVGNFAVSVAASVNTDQKLVSETIYDPNSRVERSVRVVRENGVSQNTSTQSAASVQQNIPVDQIAGGSGNNSNEENQRREELTNFEISSKTVQTTQDGFHIDRLSIAVLVNEARLKAEDETEGAEALPRETRLMQIEQLVQSAVGFSEERGDQLKVAAVAFADEASDMEPVPGVGMRDLLMRQTGTLINAAVVLVMATLLIGFGLRPAIKAVLARPLPVAAAMAPAQVSAAIAGMPELAASEDVNLIEDLTSRMRHSPQKRLQQIVEFDEKQAADILRQWMRLDERG